MQRYKGEISMPFDGKMSLTIMDGSVKSFPVSGDLNKYDITHLVARCVPPGTPRPVPAIKGVSGGAIPDGTRQIKPTETIIGEVVVKYEDTGMADAKDKREERMPLYYTA